MSITPSSTTQPEQPRSVSDELYRSKGSGVPTGKSGFERRIGKLTARNHAQESHIFVLESHVHELEIKVRELQSENDFFLKQLLERLNEKQCSAEALAVEAERLAQELETKIGNRAAPIGQLGEE